MVDRWAALYILNVIDPIMVVETGHPVAVHEWMMVCPSVVLHKSRWQF